MSTAGKRLSRAEYALGTLTLMVVGYFSLWACNSQDQSALTSTTSGVAVVLTVVAVGIPITMTQTGQMKSKAYLQQNAPAVRHAIALGAGPAITDLAELFEVPPEHVPEMGRRLRASSTKLLPLLDAGVSDQDVAQFMWFAQESLVGIPHARLVFKS